MKRKTTKYTHAVGYIKIDGVLFKKMLYLRRSCISKWYEEAEGEVLEDILMQAPDRVLFSV